jgi:hypothetical protein
MCPERAFTNLRQPHSHSHRRHRGAWSMPAPRSPPIEVRRAPHRNQRRHPICPAQTGDGRRAATGDSLPATCCRSPFRAPEAARAWFAPHDRSTAAKAAVPIREIPTRSPRVFDPGGAPTYQLHGTRLRPGGNPAAFVNELASSRDKIRYGFRLDIVTVRRCASTDMITNTCLYA